MTKPAAPQEDLGAALDRLEKSNHAKMKKTLAAVMRLWKITPTMRLGQLMWYIANGDPFYMEDDNLVRQVEKIVKRRKAK